MIAIRSARVNARKPRPQHDGRSVLFTPARAREVLVWAVAEAFGADAPPEVWRLTASYYASLARAAGLPRDERRFRRLAATFAKHPASREADR